VLNKRGETQYMQRAIELAKRGLGKTSPNPVVGAVLVKGGKIIGEGYHKKAGKAHAEIFALQDAKKQDNDVRGATLYVTLEPCSHHGRTPPCSDAVIAAGITDIVIGMIDPFPKVHGKGKKCLKAAGLQVSCLPKHSELYKQISKINQPFLKWAETGLSYVTLKAGMSLDGKIATRTGESKWITSDNARKNARIERSMCDAVLVGAGTVRSDNPELAPHGRLHKKLLLRVIFDPRLSLDTSLNVFRDKHVFVATTDKASKKDIQRFKNSGIAFKSFGSKRVSLKLLLQFFGKQGVQHIYVEGGSDTHGSFIDDVRLDPLLIDRVVFYIEPLILGGVQAIPAVGGLGIEHIEDGLRLTETKVNIVGDTLKVSGFVNKY
jgi:diaminohydroxyphosphoribosylaminopyrimidine deaminase / 5-amino-6-(5-phosphoribosylamino)uracil reductase